MASLALLQSTRISVDSSFVDYPIIGVYFAFITMVGATVVLYGLLVSPENERSLGINLNLWGASLWSSSAPRSSASAAWWSVTARPVRFEARDGSA